MENFGGFLTIASGEECKTDGEQRDFLLVMMAPCPWGGEFGICAC